MIAIGDGEEIFWAVIGADGKVGLVGLDRAGHAAQSVVLSAFDIEFDVVDALSLNDIIEGHTSHRHAGDFGGEVRRGALTAGERNMMQGLAEPARQQGRLNVFGAGKCSQGDEVPGIRFEGDPVGDLDIFGV